jgi:ubiquinone/menaquinone biosynthesis C-methylase UbiE
MIQIPNSTLLNVYQEMTDLEKKDTFYLHHGKLLERLSSQYGMPNHFVPEYSDFSRALSYSTDMHALFSSIAHPPDPSILQIGCNYGAYAYFLSLKGFRLVGIDNSEQAVKYGKRHGNLDLVVMDATELGFQDNKFDICISDGFIDLTYVYLSEKKRNATLEEAYRVLKPSGKLLACATRLDTAEFEKSGFKLQEYSYQSPRIGMLLEGEKK